MTFVQRIRVIYRKELIDILRDRRTLIAMIVVPIVLYPLLMIGSLQAVSIQTKALGDEELVIGVVTEEEGQLLLSVIDRDAALIQRRIRQLDGDEDALAELPNPIEEKSVRRFDTLTALAQAVQRRAVQVGVVIDPPRITRDPREQNHFRFLVDEEDVRSSFARDRIEGVLERMQERWNKRRKAELNLPETFDKPFVTESTDLSSPPSMLGQILPLVLVLMTITGAIYPAIDLTAGERERGTLESLMVSPVPNVDLIVGKFLVVTTVAIMGAALNLSSVTATVYFGGFDKILAESGGALPIRTMIIILLCLIPFAIFMAAIMIAVCSYARTFKEAQNYVTPVILAVLIPGGIAALPTTRLEGIMLVMPVGNMVLLARDFLFGASIPGANIFMVLLSTSLYAGAAVAVAARIFGMETVVFADAGSLNQVLSRRLIKPAAKPPVSMGLLYAALLFPVWFFVQSALSPTDGTGALRLLYGTAIAMPVLFILLPLFVAWYWKVPIPAAFNLRRPRAPHVIAAVLIGCSSWVIAHEIFVLQAKFFFEPPEALMGGEMLTDVISTLPPLTVLLLLAVLPAVSEEFLFRGLLLSSLRTSAGRWTTILVTAAVFGVFHFILFRLPVTFFVGAILALLCWQSRSILPAMLAHFLHNGINALSAIRPGWNQFLGIPAPNPDDPTWTHYPAFVIAGAIVLFVAGVVIALRSEQPARASSPFPEPSPMSYGS